MDYAAFINLEGWTLCGLRPKSTATLKVEFVIRILHA